MFIAAGLVALAAASTSAAVTSRTAVAPSNGSAPTASGTPTSGSTLTANPGTWNGSTPIAFQYQWQRCDANGAACQNIAGATTQTYVLKSDDAGNTVRIHVIASNSDGSSAALSAPTAKIAAASTAPTNSSAPTISGSLNVGTTLTANPGSWNGAAPITFTYHWLRCDAKGDNCQDIAGAAAQTYQLQAADQGKTVRVRVTARNSGGFATALSAPGATVGASTATGCPTPAPGASSVPVTAVSSPARLQVAKFLQSSGQLTSALTSFSVRVQVTDTCGQPVSGASVYATAVPYNMVSTPPEAATDASGWVTLVFNRQAGYPATPRQQLMVMFIRARKPGEPLLAGISTRRLVSLPVHLNR